MDDRKDIEYSIKIYRHLLKLFEEDSDKGIDKNELELTENFSSFIHALGTVVPCMCFNKLTNKNLTNLDMNHILNSLIFEYSEIRETENED